VRERFLGARFDGCALEHALVLVAECVDGVCPSRLGSVVQRCDVDPVRYAIIIEGVLKDLDDGLLEHNYLLLELIFSHGVTNGIPSPQPRISFIVLPPDHIT